ncbi:hypothetical protein NCC49_005682 [Naganishia albida]|nr:hypothetical protein NCC49_005682 [Naganishia albida]
MIKQCGEILDSIYISLTSDWREVELGKMALENLRSKVPEHRNKLAKAHDKDAYPGEDQCLGYPELNVQAMAQVPEKSRYLNRMLDNLYSRNASVGFRNESGELVGLKQGLEQEENPFSHLDQELESGEAEEHSAPSSAQPTTSTTTSLADTGRSVPLSNGPTV